MLSPKKEERILPMAIVITGKQIDLGDSLKQSIQDELVLIVTRYLDGDIDATVTVTKDSQHHFKTDVQLHVGRHFDVHCIGGDEDPYKSASQAMGKLEKQLRRYKTRLIEKKRHKDDHSKISEKIQKFIIEAQTEDTSDSNPLIIAEMMSEIHTLSVGDAVMQMDLSASPALIFRNAANGELNVVFKRADGNIGWIDPSLKLTS